MHRGPDDFVFCKKDGSALDPDVLRKDALYPILDRLGIPRKKGASGFHTFRHSAASIVNEQTSADRNCHYGTPLTLEKHCWRDVKAVAEPFYLLSVELTLLFQNQGHNTLAAQILCKIFLSKSIRTHQFL